MKMSRKLKRAVFGGALFTIISIMLMLGSTMAWFQDSEIVINTYTLGDLSVDIVNNEDESIATTPIAEKAIKFVKPNKDPYSEGEYLFEPGATFQLEEFYVKNTGNVDLKYRLQIDRYGATGDTKLLDAMDIYATIGDDGEPFALESNWTGMLAPDEKSGAVRIYFHMRTSAGNEYQGLQVNGLVVKVLAVQGDGIPDDQIDEVFDNVISH